MIYIFSIKNSVAIKHALEKNKKITQVEIVPRIPKGYKLNPDDQAYLDISGLSGTEITRALGQLKKDAAFWGIIDPKGAAPDPSAFFFNGASDYIGPGLLKSGLNNKRFMEALSFAAAKKSPGKTSADESETKTAGTRGAAKDTTGKKKPRKLPAGKFGGWKSIRAGTQEFFFFLFVGVAGKPNLHSLVGEAAFNVIMNRVRDVLRQSLREADALLWMETEETSLFLIPPRLPNCRAAIEAALKLILNCRLIAMEKLGLKVPVEFTIALHYGKTVFEAPGETGDIISEPVNYIFHLGAKKAEPGRLTISDDVGKGAIPEGILNIFKPAGIYEGIPIYHSRRFIYR